MKLRVDTSKRQAKMRAHTATHLLHFSLEKVLGTTKQAGSLVDNDYLRFDFSTDGPLTTQQILTIEKDVNQRIFQAVSVCIKETTLEDAKNSGAKAFFEDKYGDAVRMVQIVGEKENRLKSVELCGGTHVTNTAHIGAFKIISQEAVASGIRRISAVTGPAVASLAQEKEADLLGISQLCDSQPKQLTEKIQKILNEKASLEQQLESFQTQQIRQILSAINKRGETSAIQYVLCLSETPLKEISIKEIIPVAKALRSGATWLLFTSEGAFALGGSEDFSAKEFAKEHHLKGGGSDFLVQGKDDMIDSIISE